MSYPPQNPSSPIVPGDARLDSAVFHRNVQPIWAVLSRWIEDKSGNVLEVGSGTGQHIIEFARNAAQLLWWPSDYDERNVESIEAWRLHAKLQNVEAARRLDLCALEWGLSREDSATLNDPDFRAARAAQRMMPHVIRGSSQLNWLRGSTNSRTRRVS